MQTLPHSYIMSCTLTHLQRNSSTTHVAKNISISWHTIMFIIYLSIIYKTFTSLTHSYPKKVQGLTKQRWFFWIMRQTNHAHSLAWTLHSKHERSHSSRAVLSHTIAYKEGMQSVKQRWSEDVPSGDTSLCRLFCKWKLTHMMTQFTCTLS